MFSFFFFINSGKIEQHIVLHIKYSIREKEIDFSYAK